MDQLTAQNPTSIQGMFGKISSKYDLANSILSFGIHRRWKKRLVRMSEVKSGDVVLDCATGTGDLAFLFEAHLKKTGQIIGCDFCPPMLEVARKKATRKKSAVQFEPADVMHLPYRDERFDVASISFGIRNVSDPVQALTELGRVVKSGGRILILEFGQPHNPIMHSLFRFYSNQILPRLGGLISGQPHAYRYLQRSSAQFPCGEDFLNIARQQSCFGKMRYVSLQKGIAYLYILDRT